MLLLDGEELVGAKRNRILNTTVLVAKSARVGIPVSCVEQERWAYTSPRFAAGDASLYASARAAAGVPAAPADEARAIGLGREHRIAGNHAAAAARVVDDVVAHLMAFPTRNVRKSLTSPGS